VPPSPFTYIPTTPETLPHYEAVNAAAADLYDEILNHVPEGPDRTLAIRKLQEARMWANCAIAFGGNSLGPTQTRQ